MAKESVNFKKSQAFCGGHDIFTGVIYVADFFGFSGEFGTLTYLLSVVSTVISLYISYNIVMGVLDTEKLRGVSLDGQQLKSAWMLRVVFSIVAYVLLWFGSLAVIGIIMSFIVSVYFLLIFNNSKKLYYASAG